MKIAVIHARGGSKRIPKKNIKNFCGKPIIAFAIETALQSKLFDRVVVSTDCEQIAGVAKQHGAEVPYMRPAEFADDHTTTSQTLEYDIQTLGNPEFVCCIYATSPFIQAEYLKEGMSILESNDDIETAFSVTTYPAPILRALKVTKENKLSMFWPEYKSTRSQDLEEAYLDAGQFYWVNTKHFMKNKQLFSQSSAPIVLPRHLVQDIDTLEDWTRAEYMHQAVQLSKNNSNA